MNSGATTALAAGQAPPITGTPYLVIEHVAKRFGAFTALRNVSLTVDAGEFVCFVGPSGCGKTTLLRAVAGLDPASEGRITQGGRDITGLPPSARDFGIVFQSYALFPNLSVTDNVGYGLRGALWPKVRRRDRVAELLSLVGLTDHARKYPSQLSGGQQQRVALARALAPEPGLLLLDEPLSALDAQVRHHLRAEIRALQRRLGVTTIMVTHDQKEAMAIADRIVVMNSGLIEQVGTPEAVYRRPASAFVAGFVGRSSQFDAVMEPQGLRTPGGHLLPTPLLAPIGTLLRVFIRPEDIRLSAATGSGLSAQVTALEYLGPICRLALEDERLRLEAEASPDEMREIGARPLARLGVSLPASRLMLFPSDA